MSIKIKNPKESYRAIAKIFDIAPNTVRNWIMSNIAYKVPAKTDIKILKDYKLQREKVKLLTDKIEQFENAKKYLLYEKQIKDLTKELVKPNYFELKRKGIADEISRLNDEIEKLGEIKYKNNSTAKITKLMSKAKEKLKKQGKIKKDFETQCVFARENYDLDKIILFIESIALK